MGLKRVNEEGGWEGHPLEIQNHPTPSGLMLPTATTAPGGRTVTVLATARFRIFGFLGANTVRIRVSA